MVISLFVNFILFKVNLFLFQLKSYTERLIANYIIIRSSKHDALRRQNHYQLCLYLRVLDYHIWTWQ